MTSNGLTPRSALHAKWEAFLAGSVSAREAGSWAQDQLADYGDEEVVHDGLQLLNDHTLRGLAATPEAKASYLAWLEVVRDYDADPVAWNRARWSRMLTNLIAGRTEERPVRIARTFRPMLDDETIREVLATVRKQHNAPQVPR
jgi:hypothetical protein